MLGYFPAELALEGTHILMTPQVTNVYLAF